MLMAITAALVKQLREMTGLGMMDCKKALQETGGDIEGAVDYLRKKGLAGAAQRAGRETTEGFIASYIHSNARIGVLLELKCESDFVARNEDFRGLGRDLCMQIAAARPQWTAPEDVPEDVLAKEREIYGEQFKDKPPQAVEKIVEGKMRSFYEETCLLNQKFVKDPKTTVGDLIKQFAAKTGENIQVGRMVRLEIGE